MHYMKRALPVIGTCDFHFNERNVTSDTSGNYNGNQNRHRVAFLVSKSQLCKIIRNKKMKEYIT